MTVLTPPPIPPTIAHLLADNRLLPSLVEIDPDDDVPAVAKDYPGLKRLQGWAENISFLWGLCEEFIENEEIVEVRGGWEAGPGRLNWGPFGSFTDRTPLPAVMEQWELAKYVWGWYLVLLSVPEKYHFWYDREGNNPTPNKGFEEMKSASQAVVRMLEEHFQDIIQREGKFWET
jgi:hypothetical protein